MKVYVWECPFYVRTCVKISYEIFWETYICWGNDPFLLRGVNVFQYIFIANNIWRTHVRPGNNKTNMDFEEIIYVLTKRNYFNLYTVERKGKEIKILAVKNVFVCMCDKFACVWLQSSVNLGNEGIPVGPFTS